MTSRNSGWRWLCALVCVACCPQLVLYGQSTGQHPLDASQRVQTLVDESRSRLSIPQDVEVRVVATNPRIVSVEHVPDRESVFQLSIEADFLSSLSEDELRAVVAHELGHVWIFTHFPYLQTELLANQIAMRLVSRDTLVPVYEKVWQRAGTQGDLAAFLGPK